MSTIEYFKHARSMGFPARECLQLARQAAELDAAAEAKKKAQLPVVAYYEVLPDNSGMMKLSNGVKVY